jgi:hypothetical protein
MMILVDRDSWIRNSCECVAADRRRGRPSRDLGSGLRHRGDQLDAGWRMIKRLHTRAPVPAGGTSDSHDQHASKLHVPRSPRADTHSPLINASFFSRRHPLILCSSTYASSMCSHSQPNVGSDLGPRLREDVAQHLLHLVELGLATDQRGSDLHDRFAAVVGATVEAVLEQGA